MKPRTLIGAAFAVFLTAAALHCVCPRQHTGHSLPVSAEAATAKTTTAVVTTTAKKAATTTTYKTATQGKPVFRLSHTEVTLSEARKNWQYVTVGVEGADGLYCNTVLYVYFDKRMKSADYAIRGKAVEALAVGQALGDTGDFMVLTTSGGSNEGRDGVMWELRVKLPEDCKAGDVYTFEIGKSKYGDIQPLFTNSDYDEKGKAMQEYIFGSGLDVGTVTVVEDPPYPKGDVNDDGYIDSVDASAVLAEYAAISSGNKSYFNDLQKKSADVNSDGYIDAVDASTILAYYAYISSEGASGSLDDFMQKNR